jgi:hypothetical protein
MKSTLIRILTIATLATSISAFAADEPKHNDEVTTVASNQQTGCADRAAGKKEKKASKPQRDDQNDKDFDRVLMAIYG